MIPNIHIYEQLMLQQIHKSQCKGDQRRSYKHPHFGMLRLVIGRLGVLFLKLGTRMKRLEVAAD